MRSIVDKGIADEVVVIKTCNRYEVYMHVRERAWTPEALRDVFGAGSDLMRVRKDGSAILHLFEVAASLDSMIVGEHQILGQVRRALDTSQALGLAGDALAPVFERAIRVGRRVRSETELCQGNVSMASVAVGLVEQRLGTLVGKTALILGAGKISGMVATLLSTRGLDTIFVTNRRRERAQALSELSGATVIAYEAFREHLHHMDIVFCTSSAPHPLLHRDELVRACELRTTDMTVIDVAMPPDVDTEAIPICSIDYIALDDVRDCSRRMLEQRSQHIPFAQRIISEELGALKRERLLRERMRLARDISLHAESIRRDELEKLFSAHHDSTLDFDACSRAIVKKTLHNLFCNIRDLDLPMEKLADIRNLILTIPHDEDERSD
jgi:glutamyl-tRNA reductase